MSHTNLFNRQPFMLCPDPARVVLRAFKPATEPPDSRPTPIRRRQERKRKSTPPDSNQTLRDGGLVATRRIRMTLDATE